MVVSSFDIAQDARDDITSVEGQMRCCFADLLYLTTGAVQPQVS